MTLIFINTLDRPSAICLECINFWQDLKGCSMSGEFMSVKEDCENFKAIWDLDEERSIWGDGYMDELRISKGIARWDDVLPNYPEPPPCSLRREGDTGYLCPTCGSSLHREWRFIFLMRTPYCIQPKCKNYYGANNV